MFMDHNSQVLHRTLLPAKPGKRRCWIHSHHCTVKLFSAKLEFSDAISRALTRMMHDLYPRHTECGYEDFPPAANNPLLA